jgi:hypothetical protein
MPKWLPSTFSAMPSKATGTTPSLQDNKDRRDAIIPHQLLSCVVKLAGLCFGQHFVGYHHALLIPKPEPAEVG